MKDKPKIYNRFDKKDIDKLIYDLRRHPLDKEMLYIDLGDDMFIEGPRARCYLNAMICTVLDNYQIPISAYPNLLFRGSILKGESTKYMNKCLKVLQGVNFPMQDIMLSHVLADIKMSFGYISLVCNGVVTADHSIHDYVRLYNENEHFRKIFTEPVFLPSDSPWEIRRKTDHLIDLFKSKVIDLPPLTDFLRYGVKANAEQIMMFFCYDIAPNYLNMKEALRPMGVGIINGISTIWAIITLDAISRLAIIMGKTDVKVTGVQSKRFGTVLDKTKLNAADTRDIVEDCGNTDYIAFKIESYKDLKFFEYKWYYDPNTHEKLGWISEDSNDLIGKTVYIRSFMLCKSETVCKECYGYNWRMVADTPLYKGNFNLYVLQEFNKKMQKVISVKHHSGWVTTPMYVFFKGKKYEMDYLIRETDYFEKVDYDTVYVNPKYEYKFEPYYVTEDKKGNKTYHKEKVFIDGSEFETEQMLKPNGDRSFIYTVPNNSVLLQAEDLKIAINKHSQVNKRTGKTDFDASQLKDKPLAAQAKLMFEYERTKVKLDHFIYYEALIHSLVRDADDLSSKPTVDTKLLALTHADHALTKPERTDNISTILPHGYINGIFNTINTKSSPSEMDILYQNLTDRKILKKNIFADFNSIIREAKIKNDADVHINDRDGMSTLDMLGDDNYE